MLNFLQLFLSDLLSAVNFQTPLACFEGILLFLGALNLGLLVMPKNLARASVRALMGMPLFFILGGGFAGLLYYFGVNVFVSGNLLVGVSVLFVLSGIYSGALKCLLNWREICILFGLLIGSYLLMFFGWSEMLDGTIRAISGAWGDGVLHTMNAEAFKIRSGGDFTMPAYSGENFHEPFGYDFVAGILLSIGFTIGGAFTLPATGLLAALLGVMGSFTAYLLRKRIPNGAIRELPLHGASFVSMLLVVLGSGLQWLVMPTIYHLWSWSKFFGVHNPVWDKNEELGIAWANHLNTLVSQKHLLLAVAFLAVLSFVLYWFLTEEKELSSGEVIRDRPFFAKKGRSLIYVALILASGLLPFFHAHVFIAVVLIWLMFWVLKPTIKSFFAGVLVALIALPIFYSFGAAVSRTGFITIHLGYLVDTGIGQWILSWIINLGFFLPVVIIAMADKKWGKTRWLIALPVIILFVLGNTIQFQPYLWDNFKLFLFAWFLILPFFVAQLFAWFFQVKTKCSFYFVAVFVAVIALTMVITTVSETATYFSFRSNFPLFTPADRATATKLESVLPKDAVILTGSDTYHKSPVTLTGRNLALGYGGWIWTRGMDLRGRTAQIRQIMSADNAKELCDYVQALKITHIVIDQPTATYWQPMSSEFVIKTFGLEGVLEQTTVLETGKFCN